MKYELILNNFENLELATTRVQSPAHFLFGAPKDTLEHWCLETIDLQTKIREDLSEYPPPEGDPLFVNASSRVVEGKRVSGYAVIDGRNTTEIKKGSYQPSGQHNIAKFMHC